MDSKTSSAILGQVRAELRKRADVSESGKAFSDAVQRMAASQVRADALKDVRNMVLATAGIGAAGRGVAGLINLVNSKPKKRLLGPTTLPLPYPVETQPEKTGQFSGNAPPLSPEGWEALTRYQAERNAAARGGSIVGGVSGIGIGGLLGAHLGKKLDKKRHIGAAAGGAIGVAGGGILGLLLGREIGTAGGPYYPEMSAALKELRTQKLAGFMAGDSAATKTGVPWYGPAMLFSGLAALGGGWKGTDLTLNARRRAETEAELEQARQEFNDALLLQYDKPLDAARPSVTRKLKKTAGDGGLVNAGAVLENVFDKFFSLAIGGVAKTAIDLKDYAGKGVGGYGMYGGLTGLLTGAIVYEQIRKRSRRAVLEKAMQKRERRRFTQSPTEIYAVPEPVEVDK